MYIVNISSLVTEGIADNILTTKATLIYGHGTKSTGYSKTSTLYNSNCKSYRPICYAQSRCPVSSRNGQFHRLRVTYLSARNSSLLSAISSGVAKSAQGGLSELLITYTIRYDSVYLTCSKKPA